MSELKPTELPTPERGPEILGYATPRPATRSSLTGILLAADFALMVLAALWAHVRGDDPAIGNAPDLIAAELIVGVTFCLFIFLLGWAARGWWDSCNRQ